ncbi:hypothetical protein thalar_02658 [Litoreibacter arenae DSM 19593]|uniref:Uncharacterized protein n=1 Tax=Litoreibacter arenae DSM 19593 TaxID=1123360 RepID=S9RSI4_9RHOB|nr:hypothetical protein thalar_02658 [Litoreibacter arenae DSM 19593]
MRAQQINIRDIIIRRSMFSRIKVALHLQKDYSGAKLYKGFEPWPMTDKI